MAMLGNFSHDKVHQLRICGTHVSGSRKKPVSYMFTVEALHLTIVDYSRFLMLIPKVKSAQMKKIPSSYGFHNNFIFSFN